MKIIEKLKNSKLGKSVTAIVAGCTTAAIGAMNAFAASNISEDMKTALSGAFSSVKDDAVSLMTLALPAALAIMGIVIAIKLGIKFFKKFSN